VGHLPASVLQIGSSDGYTLSRFRESGVMRVLGVEPSAASVELAERLYQVECVKGSAEDFETGQSFELILMTHVLEHLYHPQQTLAKCRELHSGFEEGFIYIEVPLMAQPGSLCPGFFSFEHINYYTKENLIQSLKRAGYSPVSVVEHFNSNLSPVIGMLASTKEQNHYNVSSSEPVINYQILKNYRQKEISYWQGCLDQILEKLQRSDRIFLWGAGIHTSQIVANTNLLERCEVHGLTDTSPLKWGLQQGEWICLDPASIDWQVGDAVLISSYASEKEIFDSLSWLRDKGVETLRLHNIDDARAH